MKKAFTIQKGEQHSFWNLQIKERLGKAPMVDLSYRIRRAVKLLIGSSWLGGNFDEAKKHCCMTEWIERVDRVHQMDA